MIKEVVKAKEPCSSKQSNPWHFFGEIECHWEKQDYASCEVKEPVARES